MMSHAVDLHTGQTWHYRREFDLHIASVDAGASVATVMVTEFDFPFHVNAADWLDVDPWAGVL